MLTSNYDGDFDIDDDDAMFNACSGHWTLCQCAALDFDQDGDVDLTDLNAFYQVHTGALEACNPPCAGGGRDGAGQPGWTEEDTGAMGEGCEVAAWFVTHVPAADVQGFVNYLSDRLAADAEAADAAGIQDFLACIESVSSD